MSVGVGVGVGVGVSVGELALPLTGSSSVDGFWCGERLSDFSDP